MKRITDYNLSVVMPFYKKTKALRTAFQINAPYFSRNGIEVILSVDEPSEKEEILVFIREYPLINWKIIINEKPHHWRNPAKAINVGIRNAGKKYLMVVDPELEFNTDIIYEMRSKLESYSLHYCFGQVLFAEPNTIVTLENYPDLPLQRLPYGSLMAPKIFFTSINGYNESYTVWGGEDDNIRKRFDLMGYVPVYCPEARLIHREDFKRRKYTREQQRDMIPPEILSDMLLPIREIANPETWGTDFNKLIYSWDTPSPIKKEMCISYLQQMKQYEIISPEIFQQSYKVIVLIQTYNEAHRIMDCLQNVEKYCDGIILLDDDSKDNTYEIAHSEKLLLKVQKRRDYFNDLQNRNMLLDLVSFFCTDWIMFIDADETFAEHLYDLPDYLENPEVEIIGVWIANLWNDLNHYNTTLSWFPQSSYKGLWLRWRIFRNKGRMQIQSPHKLHFTPLPYKGKQMISKTLIYHSGFLTHQYRIKKIKFYEQEDIEKELYPKEILSNYKIESIQSITKDFLTEAVHNRNKAFGQNLSTI